MTNDAPAQFPAGDTIVTWTATDAFGSHSSCQQTVTVYRVLSRLDSDFDGLHNCLELYTYGTDPYNPDTDGDGLTDGEEVYNVKFATNPTAPDTDNDFWMDGAEALVFDTDPTDPNSFPAFSFTINGGADVVSSPQLHIELAAGLIADSVIVSEQIDFSSSVTNAFAAEFNYMLSNPADGLHTVFLQLLKQPGTLSPVFGRTVELDSVGPTISITWPTNGTVTEKRRINIEGFAADAATHAPALDPSRPLRVTVNGDFVNEHETNGMWWAGWFDLMPGTNTFAAVATDSAGFSVTNSVWLIYDPTLATNTPGFTMDTTNEVVVVGASTTEFALMGNVDDDNAIIQIDVVDASEPAITNATVRAAVSGTNWWTQIPLSAGRNLVVVSAYNPGSRVSTQSFSVVQDPNLFLEITSPAANTAVNLTNMTVVGRASTNLNDSIRINGQAAATLLRADSIIFSNSVPLPVHPDVNVIEVHATGTDGSSATVRQLVYGYEVVELRQINHDRGSHSRSDCWFAQHYPNDHVYQWELNSLWTWTSPDPEGLFAWNDRSLSYSGQPAGELNGSGSHPFLIGDPSYYPMLNEAGWIAGRFFRHGYHLDGGRYEFFDCPWETNCVCYLPPYCLGENTAGCCIHDARESAYWHSDYRHQLTFIKRWPTDEEQTVILHFSGLTYFMPFGPHPDIRYRQDPSETFLWGQQGLEHSRDDWRVNYPLNIGFVVKIKTNTRYTLRDRDFVVPVLSGTTHDRWPNRWSVSIGHYHGRNLYYTGFGNEKLERIVVSVGPVHDTDPARLWFEAAKNNALAAKAALEETCGGKHKLIVLDGDHSTPGQIHSIVKDRKVRDPAIGKIVDGITHFYRLAKWDGPSCDNGTGYLWQSVNPPFTEHPNVTYRDVKEGLKVWIAGSCTDQARGLKNVNLITGPECDGGIGVAQHCVGAFNAALNSMIVKLSQICDQ